MSVPVVASFNTATSAGGTTLTITKPTGLAEGDLLLAFLWAAAGSTVTFTTPTDWDDEGEVQVVGTDDKHKVFSKVADADDVAAANFTFEIGTTSQEFLGILVRVTGVFRIENIDFGVLSSATTTPSMAVNSTPLITDALVLACFVSWNGAGNATVSGYNSTPSKTWAEVAETFRDSGTIDPVIALASATAGVTTEITAIGATLSVSKSVHGCSIITLTPPNSPTATNALFEVSPTLLAPAITLTGNQATTTFFEVSPTLTETNASGTTPTQWTNESQSTTEWTNEQL